MKICYPLKKSDPTNLVEPIVKYLQISQSPQIAFSLRDNLQKINVLRDKVCSFDLPQNPDLILIDKYIPAVEMYAKYALLLAKHLNWNKDYGVTVNDLKLVWHDSFNQSATFARGQIHYDIFCCFYNLGVMYFYKANILSSEELINSKKQSIRAAKIAFYFFNKIRTDYYPSFMNHGFTDLNHSNIEMLELLSQGLIYKNLFNLFKQDQYKLGINNIASIAGQAQKKFFNAYQIAVQFFMKSSHISVNLKSQLLSFSYVEALYHDAMFNTKYAKYYRQQMDNNKDNIIYLLAYQRKALRFLELGLKNNNVKNLLDSRPEQKKDLQNILPELKESLEENILRNKKIYQKQEITQQQIPAPMQTPKKYIAQPIQPQNIKINYDNPIAASFQKLIDNQSKFFMAELKQFGFNRLAGLESAKVKLYKNIETIYNDNYVNYYINLEGKSQSNKGLPQNLKQKLQLIANNGGKKKLDLEIQIIKKNDQQIMNRFKQMFNLLKEEQMFDQQKRNQYQAKWNRPPSQMINKAYFSQIENYSKKSQQASAVNQKIIERYHILQKYINVVDQDQQTIKKSLPKVQLTKFLEQNKNQFEKLKKGINSVKNHQQQLDNLADDIKRFFNKINYQQQANKYYKEILNGNRQQIFEKIFGGVYKMIQRFNANAMILQNQARQVGQISNQLNKKNKGDQKGKKQFEEVLSKFNDINNLYRDVAQGTSFYTRINEILAKVLNDLQGFIAARKLQAQQLENSINKGGFGAGQPLPSLYPNQAPQQNLGFYIPPPMSFNNLNNIPQHPSMMGQNPYQNQMSNFNHNNMNNNSNDMSDMLADIMRSKPNFGGDIFKGPVYQSQFK